MATLCFWPGERSSIRRPPISSRPSIRTDERTLFDLLSCQPQVLRAESHIVYHTVHYQLVVGVLEDDGYLSPHIPPVLPIHGYAVYTDIPLRRVEDSGKQLDQRALPRAVLADDRDELAWFYIQVDVRKRGNRVGLAPDT